MKGRGGGSGRHWRAVAGKQLGGKPVELVIGFVVYWTELCLKIESLCCFHPTPNHAGPFVGLTGGN